MSDLPAVGGAADRGAGGVGRRTAMRSARAAADPVAGLVAGGLACAARRPARRCRPGRSDRAPDRRQQAVTRVVMTAGRREHPGQARWRQPEIASMASIISPVRHSVAMPSSA